MYCVVLNIQDRQFTCNKYFVDLDEAKNYMNFLSCNKNCNYEIKKLSEPICKRSILKNEFTNNN